MNITRLEHWITILEKVEERKLPFNMAIWFESSAEGCGTAACAAGWAARDKVFNLEGFIAQEHNPVGYSPYYNGSKGVIAVQDFFAISTRAADYITMPNEYPEGPITPSDVIIRIRQVVDGYLDGLSS